MPFYLTEYNKISNRATYWDLSSTTLRFYPNGAEGFTSWPPPINSQFTTIPVPNPPDPNAPPPGVGGLPATSEELQEQISDKILSVIKAGANVTLVPDDPANTLTISASGSGGGGGAANLALGTKTTTTLSITNSNGTGVTLPVASATEAGILAAADKVKLDAQPASAAALLETIDDQIAAVVRAGTNITLDRDDGGNTLTINATGGGSSSGVKTITSIKDDLILEPIAAGVVYCKQYWPGSTDVGQGGLFVWDNTSLATIDNGLVFAGVGNPTNGRWVRYKGGAAANILDFGAVGTVQPYDNNFSFEGFGVIKSLLSNKFSSLPLAQSWYSTSGIVSLTESLNSAVIQHAHIRQGAIAIPQGSFWLNKSIEYTRGRTIKGAGIDSSVLLFDKSAGAGFKPKPNNENIVGNNALMKNLFFEGFSFYSDFQAYNYGFNPSVVAATPFDETKSGFYLPNRSVAAEGALGNPLMESSEFKNLKAYGFAGHGFYFGNMDTTTVDNCKPDQNTGWGFRYKASIGCTIKNCYIGRFNGLGGYWLEQPGMCINLNGVDTFDKYLPWGQVGNPSVPTFSPIGTFQNCNFEGMRRALDIYGDVPRVDFQSCQWQWYIAPAAGAQQDADKAQPTIRCYGTLGSIKFDDNCYFSSGVGSAEITPTNFLWVKNNNWDIEFRAKCAISGETLKWFVVDGNGADGVLGIGFVNGLRMQAPFRTFLSSAGSLYAKYFSIFGRVSAEMLAIGYNQDTGGSDGSARNTTFAMIISGTGAPNGAANQLHRMPRGSLYLRQDGANANEVIYVCTGFDGATGVSTWVAK